MNINVKQSSVAHPFNQYLIENNTQHLLQNRTKNRKKLIEQYNKFLGTLGLEHVPHYDPEVYCFEFEFNHQIPYKFHDCRVIDTEQFITRYFATVPEEDGKRAYTIFQYILQFSKRLDDIEAFIRKQESKDL